MRAFGCSYAGSSVHERIGHGSGLEDPARPGRFNSDEIGAYRLSTKESLTASWDRSIPVEDKASWRDPRVVASYTRLALESDSTSFSRVPPSFRAPSGALEDSYYLAIGRQLWDASLLRSPTLIIASERDLWSRPEDRRVLQEQMEHAPSVEVVVIPNATHYVHLDRPERGRARSLSAVLTFLSREHTGAISARARRVVDESSGR